MAKVDTQDIPSEDRLNYKRACQISTTTRGIKYVRGRFPWRIPKMQKGGRGVSPGQKTQRDKFIFVKDKYALLSADEKKRWKDANPEYKSYLFGYNFFMLEGLMGGGPTQFPQMIKSIQVLKESVPKTGTKSFAISTVDPAKTVIMIQGSARKVPRVLRGSGNVATGGSTLNIGATVDPDKCTVTLCGASHGHGTTDSTRYAWPIFPYVSSLSSTQIGINWSTVPREAATVGWEVTEHNEGAVYPVLVSVAANTVVMDWAEVPEAGAYVSITVVEYL